MRVTTEIRKIDLIRFNLAILPKLKSIYITVLFIALLTFGFIVWIIGMPITENDWIAALLGSVGGGIAAILFGIVFSIISILLMPSSKNGIFGEHEYTISQEGLYERTSANEGLTKWTGITEVRVVGSYLIFQISGYLFHIIPARSFESDESFKEYITKSIDYWQKYR
jgi:magnesium-transporting ATPase (P-type)